MKRVLSSKLYFTQLRGFVFCSYLDIFTGNSLVERFFSTSDTRQCMVEKKLCGHARFVSHMSIISVRWTIMFRLVNIRASINVLFFYSAAHTSSLKQTRSRKSRITFKSKEDWMFLFCIFNCWTSDLTNLSILESKFLRNFLFFSSSNFNFRTYMQSHFWNEWR